jgi:hypothetical protein
MRLAFTALAAALLLPPAASAQPTPVRYEITARTSLLHTPAERARAVAQIDSGTVITVDWTEESRPAYTRVTWNGRQGWVANSAIRRIVTVRDTLTVRTVDTVRVTRVDTVVRVDTVRPERKP